MLIVTHTIGQSKSEGAPRFKDRRMDFTSYERSGKNVGPVLIHHKGNLVSEGYTQSQQVVRESPKITLNSDLRNMGKKRKCIKSLTPGID